MKKLLFAVLMCVSCLAIAQREVYSEMNFDANAYTNLAKFKVLIIYGDGKGSYMINEQGEQKLFYSVMEAINQHAKQGWTLMFPYQVLKISNAMSGQDAIPRFVFKKVITPEMAKLDSLALVLEKEKMEKLFKQREKQPNHTTDHR